MRLTDMLLTDMLLTEMPGATARPDWRDRQDVAARADAALRLAPPEAVRFDGTLARRGARAGTPVAARRPCGRATRWPVGARAAQCGKGRIGESALWL